ncbi:MAG: hypothetical protein INR65_13030, partial [Gluconacetobacter diazotrophicus]|nr:hypothetical protein [Gluconacetobacter diazotrophicus]
KPHTISLSVAGANRHFSVTGTLYLTLDKGSRVVRGALTRDTLGAPSPVVTDDINQNSGTATGSVRTASSHDYELSGYVQTSHGPVLTTVSQRNRFSNVQTFDVTASLDDQTVTQRTETRSTVTTVDGSGLRSEARVASYPLDLHYSYLVNADGSAAQTTAVNQGLDLDRLDTRNGIPVAASVLRERVNPNDTLAFDAGGAVTGHSGGSVASYRSGDLASGCVTRRETASNSVLAGLTSTGACDLAGTGSETASR